MRMRSALVSTVLALGLILGGAVAPGRSAPVPGTCNGYEPYAYPPFQNGDIIKGIGGCGSQAVGVEIWKDIAWAPDQRVGCCPRGTSPVHGVRLLQPVG